MRNPSTTLWLTSSRARESTAVARLDVEASVLKAKTHKIPPLKGSQDRPTALLGDDVAVMEGGRIVQRGTASALAAQPASPFVADFTGAVVLTGRARAGEGGLTEVDLDGGGLAVSTEAATGPVAVSIHPWEIALEPAGAGATGSARNRLKVEILSVTVVGNRARVGLAAPQPLAAEVAADSVHRLGLAPGDRAIATWKAAATRLLPLD